MTKLTSWMMGLAMIMALGFPVRLYAEAEPSQVAQDHQAMAASYEEKAAAQDALIAEHTQMKQDYKNRYFINEKLTPSGKVKKMEDHCNAIINDAQKLKDELLDFAKWHRMRAAELQGQ